MCGVVGITFPTRAPREKALLVGVADKGIKGKLSAESFLSELAQLAQTAGAEVCGSIIQQLPAPSKSHYIGKGKIEELSSLKESLNYNVIILDDELSPIQQRNLEDALKVKIIDRTALILDIFARRARTHEGRLQVELAQHQYLLPRLAGQWSHLERLGGGIGTRGPGETQLETDRRIIRQKIHTLQKKLEEVRKHRSLYRQQRKRTGVPVVSLVGYTNAGKSTLLNALCYSDSTVEDKLFATLDPTTRRMSLPDTNITVLLTDTVGFIRKLPPEIITAFRATLEELEEANLLLHVVDFSSPDAPEQCDTVEDILTELGLEEKPRITIMNKIDLVLKSNQIWDENSALQYFHEHGHIPDNFMTLISAEKGWGLSLLLKLINESLTYPLE
ncbi:GTPase HflX [Chloroflexota bacterium]